ncbi:MAG: hypothetical protein QW805_05030, partial [Candidatus Bathyarchaeia archaeon]
MRNITAPPWRRDLAHLRQLHTDEGAAGVSQQLGVWRRRTKTRQSGYPPAPRRRVSSQNCTSG